MCYPILMSKSRFLLSSSGVWTLPLDLRSLLIFSFMMSDLFSLSIWCQELNAFAFFSGKPIARYWYGPAGMNSPALPIKDLTPSLTSLRLLGLTASCYVYFGEFSASSGRYCNACLLIWKLMFFFPLTGRELSLLKLICIVFFALNSSMEVTNLVLFPPTFSRSSFE